MGNVLATNIISDVNDYRLADVQVSFVQKLGAGRILRCLKGVYDNENVVVKVYMKQNKEDLTMYRTLVSNIDSSFKLSAHPNVFASIRIEESEHGVYLIRQFFYTNLTDRLSTRPFLSMFQKKWIAYQLLNGIMQLHAQGFCHGDIKSENVMVTSWLWAMLVDIAVHKPARLPANNPSDFSFYFDTSGRRVCNIAPERFVEVVSADNSTLTPQMDIFSLGCVLFEIFTDGEHLFTLASLLKYRGGDASAVTASLNNRITDVHVRAMLSSMLSLDPISRFPAKQYLSQYKNTVFDEAYHHVLYPCLSRTVTWSSGQRTNTLYNEWSMIHGWLDSKSSLIFGNNPSETNTTTSRPPPPSSPADTSVAVVGVPVGEDDAVHDCTMQSLMKSGQMLKDVDGELSAKMPVKPEAIRATTSVRNVVYAPVSDDMISGIYSVFLSVILSGIRRETDHVVKLRAITMIREMSIASAGRRLSDDVRLATVTPYLVELLSDASPAVRSLALNVLVDVLESVEVISQHDAKLFPKYLLPVISNMVNNDSSPLVLECVAVNLARIAECSRKFAKLELDHAKAKTVVSPDTNSSTVVTSAEPAFEDTISDLRGIIGEILIALTVKPVNVKRALLTDLARMCVFMDRPQTSDVVLPLLTTFLNDPDWQLRCQFCHAAVGLSNFLGEYALDRYVLPCLVHALSDVEEHVRIRCIRSLATLVELKLFKKNSLIELMPRVIPLLGHPNHLLRAVHGASSLADVHVFLLPHLRPFLKREPISFEPSDILALLRPPVSRRTISAQLDSYRNSTPHDHILISTPARLSPLGPTTRKPAVTPMPDLSRVPSAFAANSASAAELEMLTRMSTVLNSLGISRLRTTSTLDYDNGGALSYRWDRIDPKPAPITTTLSQATPNDPEDPEAASRSARKSVSISRTLTRASSKSMLIDNRRGTSARNIEMTSSAPRDVSSLRPRFPGIPTPPSLSSLLSIAKRDNNVNNASRSWNIGVQVAHITDHKGVASCVAVWHGEFSWNNMKVTDMFCTGGYDGYIHVYNCSRVEHLRRISGFYVPNTRITDVTFVRDPSNLYIAASTLDGFVKVDGAKELFVLKVDVAVDGGVCKVISYYDAAGRSVLLYVTQANGIYLYDMIARDYIWKTRLHPSFGAISAVIVDPDGYWFLLGTARGFLNLYDCRYLIPLMCLRVPSHTRINAFSLYNTSESQRLIVADDTPDVFVWRISTRECRQCLRSSRVDTTLSRITGVAPLEESVFTWGAYQDTVLDVVNVGGKTTIPSNDEIKNSISSCEVAPRAVLGIPEYGLIVTGGADSRIRCWNMSNSAESAVISDPDGGNAKYDYSEYEAYWTSPGDGRRKVQFRVITESREISDSVIHKFQANPYYSHRDTITALAYVNLPMTPLLISASRDGVVKLWK